jgi:uncharacterized protein
LLPVTSIPFWNLDDSIAEVQRCKELGHRSVNFCNDPASHGYPTLADKHWDPLWAACQEAGTVVNFHIGGADIGHLMMDKRNIGWQAHFAQVSSMIIVDNMRCVGDLIFGGICHRFPNLKFVSVESGVGWIPGVLETFDWQWGNSDIGREHAEYDLKPSEYFRRQIYGCFWFEQASARFAIEQYPDNILYETDFPHPTCQHPGPKTMARNPRDYAQAALSPLPAATIDKVLHANAARLYDL